MKAKAYLAPYAPARFSYTGNPYPSGPKPQAIVEMYTSREPGFLHIDLANGCKLTVETGKGYLLPVADCERN